mmetsp:Transcript_67551/g.133324  ORF Transcript_67551/g.133324 Transcript_67551/m.133324 type:complete len:557 (+) Transcript_67551:13-1683(+)|eukprot:CAMPEP_0172712156 /NCGR_PEP_ID=MMETSP1074-20121228/60935_1 /TAXON_ID=2916 /ORGANISM="Ceratium fusus, Strain PA161109" /LENGTH=556 /DNA_ID=CAMNT_0013536045 /DNA_START=13 /DNA_END=1683 /DNA_ORIENTATION=-
MTLAARGNSVLPSAAIGQMDAEGFSLLPVASPSRPELEPSVSQDTLVSETCEETPRWRFAKQAGFTAATVLLLATIMSTAVFFSINVQDPSHHQQLVLADETPVFLWSEGAQRVPKVQLTVPPACKMGDLPTLWKHEATGPHLKVKVLTYNLYWWSLYGKRQGNHGSAAKLIKHTSLQEPYDVMAFQECMDPTRILLEAGLLDQYMAFEGDGSGTSAICLLFHRATWGLLAHGSSYVAEDTQAEYYGRRAAQWLHLRHRVTGHGLFVMNHHGPLPINSGGLCGGKGTAYNLLQLIARHAQHGEAIVLVGDFNANAASATIQHLHQRLYRTYAGNFLGGIDNVFSNIQASSVAQRANLGRGGSDHDALTVTFELGLHKGAKQKQIATSRSPGLRQSAGSASIAMLPQANQGRLMPSAPPATPSQGQQRPTPASVPEVPPSQFPSPPWQSPGSKRAADKRANAIFLPLGALAHGQPAMPQRPSLQPPQPGQPAPNHVHMPLPPAPAVGTSPAVRQPLLPVAPSPTAGDINQKLQPPSVGGLPMSRSRLPREDHPMYFQ